VAVAHQSLASLPLWCMEPHRDRGKRERGASDPHRGQDVAAGWWILAGDDGYRRRLHKLVGEVFQSREREFTVGKDVVEDSEGVGAFYRPEGSGRWEDGKRPVARWSFKALKPSVSRRGNGESVIGCGRGRGDNTWFPGTEGEAAKSAHGDGVSPNGSGGGLGSRQKMPSWAGVGPQDQMGGLNCEIKKGKWNGC
jgi:hypothetical protein